MRRYRRTVVSGAGVERVWSYLADFTTTNEWDPRASGSRLVSGDGGPGTRYATDVHFLGRTTRMLYTILLLDEPQRIEWVGENGTVRAHDVIEVRSLGTGSVLEYVSSYDDKVAPALMDRLMSRPLDRLCDEAHEGLQATLLRL